MELTLDEALQKAVEAHKGGQIQEADRLYTAILQAQPKHPDANHNMGVLAVGVGKVQEALPFFKTALEANPSIGQYWLSYIDALITLDRITDARSVLNQAKGKGAKGEVSQFAPKSTPHIVPPFLTKLYDMVNCDKYKSLIHWSNDGKAVCISNIKQFSEVVLPQYFKHSKFASFLRQLNMYNFYTTRQEPELREFKNPNFIRDNVNLMSCIKRKRAQVKSLDKDGKSTSKRQKLSKQKQKQKQQQQQGSYKWKNEKLWSTKQLRAK